MFQLQIYSKDMEITSFGRKITIKGIEGFIAGDLIKVADTGEDIFHFRGYVKYPGTEDCILYANLPYYGHKENFFKAYKETLCTLCNQFLDLRLEYCGVIKDAENEKQETNLLPDFMKMLQEVAETYSKTLEIDDEQDYKFNTAHLY